MNTSEIVISGLSCRFAESDSADEFWANLVAGKDLLTADDRRFPAGVFGLPKRFGKVKDPTRFDAKFFSVHAKQAEKMDPQLRMLLEVSYEALLDAGLKPQELKGSRTGVFVGACFSDTHCILGSTPEELTGYENTGCAMSMLANRLSFFYDFHGPSLTIDTACSSALVALDRAVRAIRAGECEVAIVGGASLVHRPSVSVGFNKLQMLSPSGACRSFDQSADGYARSDGIGAVIVMRADLAHRSYARVLGVRTNSDGYKEQGITFPSGPVQAQLLREVYAEAGVDPQEVSYIEAHGTGTQAGDPQEVSALAQVFEPKRRGADRPLLLGSVKSNAGHAEGASGLVGVIKVLLAMQHELLPGNLHFTKPNKDIAALQDGSVTVVAKNTPWEGGIAGVNSFGFGGTNAHVILAGGRRFHEAAATPIGAPTFLPFSGRSDEGLQAFARTLESWGRPSAGGASPTSETKSSLPTAETVAFFQSMAELPGFELRGGLALTPDGRGEPFWGAAPSPRPPVYFVFPGQGSQWPKMGADLLQIPSFRRSLEACHAILAAEAGGFDLLGLITRDSPDALSAVKNSFVAITAVQLCVVDFLRSHGVHPDGIIGHSAGEIACGYADGGLTRAEALLTAFHRGRCVEEMSAMPGKMVVVERSWDDAQQLLRDGVVAACHNSQESVTLSGPVEAIDSIVAELEAKGERPRSVESSGIAFHSPLVAAAVPALRAALEQVLPTRRPRTERWLCTSRPEAQWADAHECSAEYFVANFSNPVLFAEALAKVPRGALVIEMGPHSLMRASILDAVEEVRYVHTMRRGADNRVELQNALGRCFQAGVAVDWFGGEPAPKLVGKRLHVPSRSPWDHAKPWPMADLTKDVLRPDGGRELTCRLDLTSDEDRFLGDHLLFGHIVFPGVGYLWLVWRTLARLRGVAMDSLPVRFDEVQFKRVTMLRRDEATELKVSLLPAGGRFEVVESGEVVASGTVTAGEALELPAFSPAPPPVDGSWLQHGDVYQELRLRGYEYGEMFKTVEAVHPSITWMRLAWRGNWVTFLDGVLQATAVGCERELFVPTALRRLQIDPRRQPKAESVDALHERHLGRMRSTALLVEGLELGRLTVSRKEDRPLHAAHTFVPLEQRDLLGEDPDQRRRYTEVVEGYVVQQARAFARWCEAGGHALPRAVRQLRELFEPLELPAPSDDEVRRWAEHPHAHALRLARHVFSQPQALLTEPMPLILSFEEYARVYRDDLGSAAVFNGREVGALLDVVLENRGTLGPVRVAEVGAGTGGLTHHVLPTLRTHEDRYIVTDVSGGFFDALRQEFAAYSEVTEYTTWDVLHKKPEAIAALDLIVASNVIHAVPNLRRALTNICEALDEGGFFLLHEITHGYVAIAGIWGFIDTLWQFDDPEDRSHGAFLSEAKWTELLEACGFEVVSIRTDERSHTLFLCRRSSKPPRPMQLVHYVDAASSLGAVQQALADAAQKRDRLVWLVGDRKDAPGLLGLANCARKEPDGDLLRTVFLADADADARASLGEDVWEALRRRDLAVNVLQEGLWGTYRMLELAPLREPRAQVTLDVGFKGDLSTLQWRFAPTRPAQDHVCDVHYCSVNFKDLMLTTDRLAISAAGSGGATFVGEFSGIGADGARVMGGLTGSMASQVSVPGGAENVPCLWRVPDQWSLEQAATVPVVYSTVYLALLVRARLRPGQRILIHAGAGGVGQAAIRLARSLGCEIFTTVGTPEKRAFLRQTFPDLPESHIGNSRDTSFEEMVMSQTRGRGVDVVLNSLAGDKLQASLRVLSRYGSFVEIGKYDMTVNSPVGMGVFLRDINFYGVGLDNYGVDDHATLREVTAMVAEGIRSGVVQPLPATVFGHAEVEAAFRYMAQGKHIGKVLIRMKEEPERRTETAIHARPRFWCDPGKSYLVTGGLGGVGFELAEWLVRRGARHLTLSARSELKNAYQRYHVERWRSRGVEVTVSQEDITTEAGAEALVTTSQRHAPLGAVFHLAMVMKDALLANQGPARFDEVVRVKYRASEHLDVATRKLAPALEHFVLFSSLAGSIGNSGQASYGYANLALDRLAERRRAEGLPAVSVQWGAIGDVGFVNTHREEIDVEALPTKEQSLGSCLATLDELLFQRRPVVASSVPDHEILRHRGEKAAPVAVEERSFAQLLRDVRNILGIAEGEVIEPGTQLVELGMDSLMAVELRNKLQKDYGLRLSLQGIRTLTLVALRQLLDTAQGKASEQLPPTKTVASPVTESMRAATGSATGAATEEPAQVFELLQRPAAPREAIYLVGGMAADPSSMVAAMPLPQGTSAHLVRFERGRSMADLTEAWLAHLEELPASADSIHVVGYSVGALIVYRLKALLDADPSARARLGSRKLRCTTISPPRPEALAPLSLLTSEELEGVSTEEGLARIRAIPVLSKVDVLGVEDVRAQVRFMMADHFYRLPLGRVDVTILPDEDPITWDHARAAELADEVRLVAGTHDLQGLPLSNVLA